MSASTSSTTAVVTADSLDMLGGLQLTLLWLCVVGGVVVCATILLVTLRHQRLKGGAVEAGYPSTLSGAGAQPGGKPVSRLVRAQALLMEAVWVMVPLLIVLGLGAWVVASHLGYPR